MTEYPTNDDLVSVVRQALRREAEEKIADGFQLVEGRWVAAQDGAAECRTRSRKNAFAAAEAIAFWSLAALLGMSFMAVVVLIL